MKYRVRNESNGHSYELESAFDVPLEMVWNSQKSWFPAGSTVTILDVVGNSQTFTK